LLEGGFGIFLGIGLDVVFVIHRSNYTI
jgi:hypothetical protein